MKDKSVVVTGGAGFIGSNLARALVKENRVVILDDLSTGHLQNIRDLIDEHHVEFIQGSITDIELLQKTFRDIDVIFHEAAIPSVPRSIKNPVASHLVNATGTLNVLMAAQDNGVQKVVYASSSSVYGDTPTLPKKEDMTPCPLSPYAVSKLTAEYYCSVFSTAYELPTVSLRYFNVYGPFQDPLGEYAAVIPKFIMKLAHDEPPIIYGDGEQTRDFTFISDVVAANIRAADSPAVGVFNVSGGERTSLNELTKILMKIYLKKIDIIYEQSRPGDIKHSLADISKAKQHLGYHPTYTLHKGLQETAQWFQHHQ
ncbi:MAG: SDR family oxidoreductase [Candidatus Thermoplasmatota archaeon]|nr:SDR family oxidoreductase [Candidatus Thermoplasmatota archaeon]